MKLVCIVDHLLLSCCLTITNSFILQATRNSPMISICLRLQDKTLCGFCHLLRGRVRGEELGPAGARSLCRDVPVRASAPQDPLPRGEHEAKHASETRYSCHSVQNLHWCSYQQSRLEDLPLREVYQAQREQTVKVACYLLLSHLH